jgi:hypothetical protein
MNLSNVHMLSGSSKIVSGLDDLTPSFIRNIIKCLPVEKTSLNFLKYRGQYSKSWTVAHPSIGPKPLSF